MTGNVSSIADRARNGAPAAEQDGREIGDEALERLLDKREDKKAQRKAANAAFKTEDDRVKARLSEYELADGEVARIGKYRIEKKASAGRSVSFDTSPSSRLNISVIE